MLHANYSRAKCSSPTSVCSADTACSGLYSYVHNQTFKEEFPREKSHRCGTHTVVSTRSTVKRPSSDEWVDYYCNDETVWFQVALPCHSPLSITKVLVRDVKFVRAKVDVWNLQDQGTGKYVVHAFSHCHTMLGPFAGLSTSSLATTGCPSISVNQPFRYRITHGSSPLQHVSLRPLSCWTNSRISSSAAAAAAVPLSQSIRKLSTSYHGLEACQNRRRDLADRCRAIKTEQGVIVETLKSLSEKDVKIVTVAIITVLFSISNRILYKMALVSMREYPFLLAQMTTFGCSIAYSTILYFRIRAGIVTKEMLNIPKAQFVAVGALEALGFSTGMAAGAVLPGALPLVFYQVLLVWQLLLSASILGRRYGKSTIGGCFLVVVGVVIIALASSAPIVAASEGGHWLLWPSVMMLSAFFAAAASILKEHAFTSSGSKGGHGSVDIFVVNSFSSGFQTLFLLIMLPLLSKPSRGMISFPTYVRDGATCFFNAGASGQAFSPCVGAPLVPLVYVLGNMSFNIAALSLLKASSAVVSSLTTTLAVPLAIYAFTMPLPLLGSPHPLSPGLLSLGSSILVLGLTSYNLSKKVTPASNDQQESRAKI
ncbi:hypothetical protein Mapa_016017 [Marchantia paleacea]|nr:hypothetical protein Mapa_016017 [Marchantia paleacea]